MKKVLIVLGLAALTATSALAGTTPGTGILGSGHDMNFYGTGSTLTDAVDPQGRVCAYCHTPHHARTTGSDYLPLWSREVTSADFIPYFTATIDANIVDPLIGPTRLCMSCHDGTIALDAHYGRTGDATFVLTGDDYPTVGASTGVGVNNDLSNDHPVGFDYTAVAGGPDTLGVGPYDAGATLGTGADKWIRDEAVSFDRDDSVAITVAERLYDGKYMTCATCHDVHNQKNATNDFGGVNYFVLAPQQESRLCRTCHVK